MKPSDFILNSDYLSIAQTGSSSHTVTVASGSLAGQGGSSEQNFNFTVPAQAGAVDRVLISKDGGRYYVGAYRGINPATDVYGFINVFRTSATNIRAQVVLENYSASTTSYPSMTFDIKVSTFKPPNVF